MEDSLLQKLANIAIIRQHINHIVNSTPNKKTINPIQKVAAKLDLEFTELLISSPNLNLNGDIVNVLKLEDKELEQNLNTNKQVESSDDLSNRPRIRASKKTNKDNASK
jgi:hypothetical protein